MGAYAPGSDPLIDEAIVRRPELLDFLTPGARRARAFDGSVAAPDRDDGVMSALVRQRARIVRVRRIQHGLAATAAAAGGRPGADRSRLARERLLQMRGELQPVAGPTTGAALARMGELAMRLDSARYGLGPTIDMRARAAAAMREAERLAARRDQESAEKLEGVAHRAPPRSWPNGDCARPAGAARASQSRETE